jgi:hypothetical protein
MNSRSRLALREDGAGKSDFRCAEFGKDFYGTAGVWQGLPASVLVHQGMGECEAVRGD